MPVTPGVPGANLPPGDDALIRRIQELERAQRETLPAVMAIVGPQLASLTTAVANITTLQGQMSTQIANVTALVNAQISVSSGANSQTATLATTESSYAVVTFTVPSGYTQAQVFGFSSMYCSSGTYVYLQTRIAGVNGQVQYALGVSPGTGNAASGHARTLTSLVAGSTFTVEVRANTASSTVTAVMLTAAQAVFLR